MIIPAGERATEAEITLALIEFLKTRSDREADFKTLRFYLPSYIKLSRADKEVARERDAELKWHTVLRNIGAHAKQRGNAIHDGILGKRRGGGYYLRRTPNAETVAALEELERGGGKVYRGTSKEIIDMLAEDDD